MVSNPTPCALSFAELDDVSLPAVKGISNKHLCGSMEVK